MATKTMHPLDNARSTAVLDRAVLQKSTGKLAGIRRLSTYGSKGGDIHPTCSKGLLAKLGFVHTNKENIIQCEGCSFTIELSTSASELIEKHGNQSPDCVFILNNSEVYSPTNQQNLLSTSNISRTDNLISNNQIQLNHIFNNFESDLTPQKSFLNSLSDVAITKLRTDTFSNWPVITPSAQDMITAGWYYTNIADRVMCVYCDALYHKWTESDRPYQIHQLKSPQCPFVLSTEKKATTTAPTTNITITTEPNTQAPADAANSAYAPSHCRYETFKTWPHTEENPLPPVESFVNAGFYYTGVDKIVQCFYCNGALRDWQSTDEPKVEHARWYPNCVYIRQHVGEDLYQAIQRKNRELKAQQNVEANTTNQTSQVATWSHDEIDRMVKARLDLPCVEKLRQAGFTMAIIRKSFEMQLKFKKDDFKTDYDLQIACLILDQQVKLINGNEANLLIPHDWMKKYIQDQTQGVHQSNSQQHLLQTPIKSVETPKVLAPVVTGPKIVQTLAEEALPCILCLTTERQVACLPCGHLTSCVACGHSMKTCPICRAPVKAFVRIYV